jgi:hypothetical protein
VAEFVVPNPAAGPYQRGTASPPPLTRTSGPLAVTLTELATGSEAPRRLPPRIRERIWTHAAFRVTENGRLADRWGPVGITIADATGNVMRPVLPGPFFRSRQAGETHLRFLGNLPGGEPAWKLREEFVPIRGFAPADLWTLRGIVLPRGQGEWQTAATALWFGRTLHLSVRTMARPWWKGEIYVDTSMEPLVDGLRVGLVRAKDDRGRSCLPSGREWINFLPSPEEAPQPTLVIVSPFGSFLYPQFWAAGVNDELRPAADARSVDLTYAVVKSRFAEFAAKPRRQ